MDDLSKRLANRQWAVLLVVAYALFIDYFMYGLVVPLTPYGPLRIAGESQLGLLYGGYAVGVLLATPVFGYLGQKRGCKPALIFGVVLMAVSTLLFAFGSNFALLLIARIMQGASAAASWTCGLALVAQHFHEKRVQMMGLAMVGSTAGSIVGPTVGSLLFELGGYLLPFQTAGCMVAIDVLLIFFLLPDKRTEPAGTEHDELRSVFLDRSVLSAAIAVALSASAWGLIEPLLPIHIEKAHVGSPHVIGPMFTFSTIAYGLMAPVVNYAAERFSVTRTVCCGMISMAIALPLLAAFSSTYSLGFILCLVSMSYAFVLNPTSAELANAVDRRGLSCYTMVYAVYNIAYSLGMMAADLFAATLAEHLSFLHSLMIMSAVMLAGTPLFAKSLSRADQGVEDACPEGDTIRKSRRGSEHEHAG